MQRVSNHSRSLAILLVALTLVAGCDEQHSRVQLDPTAPLASPAAPLRDLNYAAASSSRLHRDVPAGGMLAPCASHNLAKPDQSI